MSYLHTLGRVCIFISPLLFLSLSFISPHSLSLSPHSLSLYLPTLSLSFFISTLSLFISPLSLSLYLPTPSLHPSLFLPPQIVQEQFKLCQQLGRLAHPDHIDTARSVVINTELTFMEARVRHHTPGVHILRSVAFAKGGMGGGKPSQTIQKVAFSSVEMSLGSVIVECL